MSNGLVIISVVILRHALLTTRGMPLDKMREIKTGFGSLMCEVCHRLFKKKNPQHLYCSYECQNKAPRQRFGNYKSKAKRRNLSFELTFDIFNKLIHGRCTYCHSIGFMGIDRCDNKKGYTVENSVSCCWNCNRFKNILSSFAYVNICKMVASVNL